MDDINLNTKLEVAVGILAAKIAKTPQELEILRHIDALHKSCQ